MVFLQFHHSFRILQNYRFAMFEAYKALQAKKAKVYSVKCDAFTHRDALGLVIKS